jgi:antitoxin VapB
MGLSIKSGETQRLAQELAALTGESMATAVTAAVRERLDRLRGGGVRPSAEKLLEIGRLCADRLPEPQRSADHGDLLYGADGLPK